MENIFKTFGIKYTPHRRAIMMSILYYFSFFVLFSIAFQFSQNNLPDTHNPLLLIYAPTRDTIFSILSGIFSFFKRFTSSSSEIFASLQDVVNAFIRFFKFIFGDVFYLIQSTFQLIKAIIMLPIDFILDFTASFDRLMSLFSKFLKTLLLTLYSLSKKILTPIPVPRKPNIAKLRCAYKEILFLFDL